MWPGRVLHTLSLSFRLSLARSSNRRARARNTPHTATRDHAQNCNPRACNCNSRVTEVKKEGVTTGLFMPFYGRTYDGAAPGGVLPCRCLVPTRHAKRQGIRRKALSHLADHLPPMPPRRRSSRLVKAEKERFADCCTVRRLLLTDKRRVDGVDNLPEDDEAANTKYKYFAGCGDCYPMPWTRCVNYDDCKSETCSRHGNKDWYTKPVDWQLSGIRAYDISAWQYIHEEGQAAIDKEGYWFDKTYDCCGKWICGLCLPSSKFYIIENEAMTWSSTCATPAASRGPWSRVLNS